MAYTEAALETATKQIEADTKDFPPQRDASGGSESKAEPFKDDERLLLPLSSGKLIAQWLEIPEIHAEIDRAVWQVDKAIQARRSAQQAAEQATEQTDKSRNVAIQSSPKR